jgi:hypothetical protein
MLYNRTTNTVPISETFANGNFWWDLHIFSIIYYMIELRLQSRSFDTNVISGRIYIFLYYIVYNRTTITILISDTIVIVISGGIYIYIYYILYRTTITNLISDAFAIFVANGNFWWDLHISII